MLAKKMNWSECLEKRYNF